MKPKIGFFAVLALMGLGSAYAETQSKFLQLTQEQRDWYLEGSVMTAAHLIYMHDKTKGDCASKWYFSDKAAKRKIIEATLAKYPEQGPTTVVLALLGQACGPIAPAQEKR